MKKLIKKLLILTVIAAMVVTAMPLTGVDFTNIISPEAKAATKTETFTWGDYEYRIINTNEVEITAYWGSDTEVIIPSEIDGKPVTSVGEYSFTGGYYDGQISQTPPPTNLMHPNAKNNEKIQKVVVPSSVKTIGEEAFSSCTSLTSITIPESVTIIKDNVFYDCISLSSITIPKSVTTIGSNAFLYCTKLKEIKVEEENQNYCSVDGILFSKDKSELVCYPDNKDGAVYEIPETVVTIGNNAFNHCNKLTKITIPESVTTIKSSAFDACEGLKIISIPQSVTSIEDYAFVWCGNLKSIIVLGSPNLIGDAIFRGCDVLTIYCSQNSSVVQYAKDKNIKYKETVIYSITNKLTNISSDGEIYTSPELGDYTVTLTANKGYKLPSTISVKVDGQELLKEQYTYTYELTTGKLIIPVTGNIEIEASGERKYEVIFDANGGSFTEERKTLIYEDWKYTDEQGLEEPTRKGYNFIGYYTKHGASFKHIMGESGIDEDMTFYAKWEEKELKQIKVFEHSENQQFVIGKDKELVFELDNDRGEGKVFVDGKELNEKDEYYTWNFVEGIYPSIELSEEYIKTLGLGKHTIKFIVDEEFYAETTFTIVEQNVEDEEQENIESDVEDSNLNTDKEENNSEKEENKLDNPKTGDSILLFAGLFIISIIGILATTKFIKNYKNK